MNSKVLDWSIFFLFWITYVIISSAFRSSLRRLLVTNRNRGPACLCGKAFWFALGL